MYLTQQPIRIEDFLNNPLDPANGARVFFAGVVRNQNNGQSVQKLSYDCFASMAHQQISRIIEEVRRETKVAHIQVLHRTGWLIVGETALVVIVDSVHRRESFEACEKIVEKIKHHVPIWKKEIYSDGTMEWVSLCSETVLV